MAEMKWERCKFHYSLAKKAKHTYQLQSIGGDCLENVGVPNKGRALINCQIEPKVGGKFDYVHNYCPNFKRKE